MKTILIAYDGTPGAKAALQDLHNACLPGPISAHVLAVAEVWLSPQWAEAGAGTDLPPAVRQARAAATRDFSAKEELAKEGAALLQAQFPHWQITSSAVADSAAWGIINEGDSRKVDLIVAGSQGRSFLDRIFLGSVAHKIAAEAHSSVRITRPKPGAEGQARKILVSVDGSPSSLLATEEVVSRSWPAGSEIFVITVLDAGLQTILGWANEHILPWKRERDHSADNWVTRMNTECAEKLRAKNAGWQVHQLVLEGDAKSILLREAEVHKVEAIFLGAKGIHHGNRLFLGSTASSILSRGQCSVEVVRQKGVGPSKAESNPAA